MNRNEIYLEMESISENESFARIVVAAFITRLNPTLEQLADIKTAVSEAVTNAIIHGYGEKEGKIKLKCQIEGRELRLWVIDDGVGISDVKKAMEPLYTTRPEWERSGMGFTFMETFMDHLEVESKPKEGTTVYMVKQL
ncbi:anti-sigma F factor [Acetivibrio ethanolgignens]|uniref:Anti-sigma F factor n=1 Tax=Acetivibrio ethanolgignens TaxID=290052 RepID=A0A0V8QD04_9FIRM|nr:anti-sigma F factor [Acetivibrio ethanolgignens]KSV58362.1 anti-sigma F factor [Acetivibrio ethanolgignens]